MEYSIKQLSDLSGVSIRTLRHYDAIGLLKPSGRKENGYRIYTQKQADLLQQILFYREAGLPLQNIKEIVCSPDFNLADALKRHLAMLEQKRRQIETLIKNAAKTLAAVNGEDYMNEKEKFEGFMHQTVEENEARYGAEIRQKYGDAAVDASNAKAVKMTEAQWQQQEQLSEEIFALLKKAMVNGNPACADAQKACGLHRQWLCMFWADGHYNPEKHMAIGEMYVADTRFTGFYDGRLGSGAAQFLCDALAIYTNGK